MWDKTGPGSRLRRWPSPREHLTPSFALCDQTARDADFIYDDLSTARKDAWEETAQTHPWWSWCLWWQMQPVYYEGDALGPDAFRGVQLARLLQDLPFILDPPDDANLAADDVISLSLFGGAPPGQTSLSSRVLATWTRTAPATDGPYVLSCWLRTRATFPSGTGQRVKATFIGYVFIEPDEPVDLSDILITSGRALPNAVLDFSFSIAKFGSAPFAIARAAIRLPETNAMMQGSGVSNGRLTLASGVPVPVADIVDAATLYFTPYNGDRIALWDGFHWNSYPLVEMSKTLAGIVDTKLYDVFLGASGCTLALSLSAAWASDSARTDALALTDGVLTLASNKKKKYLGTIRATATDKASDTARQRFVANQYNAVTRRLELLATEIWTSTAGVWTLANAGNADGAGHSNVEFVIPGTLPSLPVDAHLQAAGDNYATISVQQLALALDQVTTPEGLHTPLTATGCLSAAGNTNMRTAVAHWSAAPNPGYHSLNWIDITEIATTSFWCGRWPYSPQPSIAQQGGIQGTIHV